MRHLRTRLTLVVVAAVFLAASAQQKTSLKDAYHGVFHVGAAINRAQILGDDAPGAALIKAQFDAITPENALKWESVHPTPAGYDFALPDRYVAFGEQNQMYIVGHTLVWHSQTPTWVFNDKDGKPLDRNALLQRMHDHIQTVVGRYKGRIQSWDVVNEALNEDGSLRHSPWSKIIGEDYILQAFQFAHEADPKAELTYNDYSLENAPKRNGAIALIKKLKAQGVPIASVGIQEHINLEWPSMEQLDETIAAFGDLGVKVMITELDIDVLPRGTKSQGADVSLSVEAQAKLDPYTKGLPADAQQKLAKRYADLFAVYMKHRDVVGRVTFWGVTDKDSWLNNWPVRGRTNYPLLFDRTGQPKPAFEAVIRVAQKERAAK